MGVRLQPLGARTVSAGGLYSLQATSAETNVLSVPASLGLPALALTCFVEGSPIAAFIKGDLRRRGIAYRGPELPQGGPWGLRHQFNIADSGFGVRGPVVHNDRAGEVGLRLRVEDFDLKTLFEQEGVAMLHISGLIAALSPSTGAFCLSLASAAKAAGTMVSFDINYRASFWKGREAELRDVFTKIATLSDILCGNEEDFQLALGVEGPESGGRDLATRVSGFREMILRLRGLCPRAVVFATTLRQVLSASSHLWGSILFADGDFSIIEPREIDVLDRIGGGDGFVGGLLYGLLNGRDLQTCNSLAWACGAMAVTVDTDYARPESEMQLYNIYKGNARVVR
jgi:2-dehydro-3-deoxygluconokinase